MLNEPVPKEPTVRSALTVQLEPAPLTVTVPFPAEFRPTQESALETVAPDWTFMVPTPPSPTVSWPVLDQAEPAPVTVTVPLPPALRPTKTAPVPLVLVEPASVEPPEMVTAAAPNSPMIGPLVTDTVDPPVMETMP